MSNLQANLKELAKEYIGYEPHEPFRSQVEKALKENDEKLLQSMFGKRIAFGTAGLRSKMYGGYANMNDLVVLQTSQGLSRYAEKNIPDSKKRGIIIGYDGRYNSERFAKLTASVFSSQGYTIYLFNRIVPTPFVPYGILKLHTALGIMVTASHNPKEDNGYKVYWENGAQIIPPHDEGIAKSILENLKPWNEYKLFDLSTADPKCDVTDLISDSYIKESVERYQFCKDKNHKIDFKLTYTPMHGVGGYWMTKVFDAFNLPKFIPVKEQFEPDPEFHTVKFPNPEEGKGALALAMKLADEQKSPLILANDPDADRLAVAEKDYYTNEWNIFTGNEIAILLSDWVFEHYLLSNPKVDHKKLCMISSAVSSKYLQAMADYNGFTFRDTLTGFKWIGNCAIDMIKQGYIFLFGYEVEIGFLVGDLSFDKDGVRTAAIFYEMAGRLYKSGKTCTQRIKELRIKYGFFEMDTSYVFMEEPKLLEVFKRLRIGFNGNYPTKMGPYNIKRIRDVTTGYDSGEQDKKSKLPIQPNQQMITFWFDNGAVCTLRNSGTEPKLKYYLETFDKNNSTKAKEDVIEMKKYMLKEFMQT